MLHLILGFSAEGKSLRNCIEALQGGDTIVVTGKATGYTQQTAFWEEICRAADQYSATLVVYELNSADSAQRSTSKPSYTVVSSERFAEIIAKESKSLSWF